MNIDQKTHPGSLQPDCSAAWIEASERMPQEPTDFPCWGYWGKACHGENYDCRGPTIMRAMFNDTLTHWMPIDLTQLPVPAPPNDRTEPRRERNQ